MTTELREEEEDGTTERKDLLFSGPDSPRFSEFIDQRADDDDDSEDDVGGSSGGCE